MATMGLSCAHIIQNYEGMTFSLDLVHSHWRIDTRSLDIVDESCEDNTGGIVNLLSE
jgi:hypothetical protein